ncbi:MAG: hypothetical protein D084_Lepto4C00267G0003 [Leptospirillum sp. Group IV 'UBA BS']|nr:MAG: hypothetical protein D084_Lepto4C00267G0003 [Leptospirillum sp. Group IV 'UBA BS']
MADKILQKPPQNKTANAGIPDNASFFHVFRRGFKLGLDKA